MPYIELIEDYEVRRPIWVAYLNQLIIDEEEQLVEYISSTGIIPKERLSHFMRYVAYQENLHEQLTA